MYRSNESVSGNRYWPTHMWSSILLILCATGFVASKRVTDWSLQYILQNNWTLIPSKALVLSQCVHSVLHWCGCELHCGPLSTFCFVYNYIPSIFLVGASYVPFFLFSFLCLCLFNSMYSIVFPHSIKHWCSDILQVNVLFHAELSEQTGKGWRRILFILGVICALSCSLWISQKSCLRMLMCRKRKQLLLLLL